MCDTAKLEQQEQVIEVAAAPPQYDVRHWQQSVQPRLNPAFDQRDCGLCVAATVAAAAEAAVSAALHVPASALNLSRTFLFYCTPGGQQRNCGTGWNLQSAMQALTDSPIPSAACIPNKPSLAAGAAAGAAHSRSNICPKLDKCPKTLAEQRGVFRWRQLRDMWEAQDHMRQFGSVITLMTLYYTSNQRVHLRDYYASRPASAAYSLAGLPANKTRLKQEGHAVLLIGYDNKRQLWQVQSSYGPAWADRGSYKNPYGVSGIAPAAQLFGIEFLPFDQPQQKQQEKQPSKKQEQQKQQRQQQLQKPKQPQKQRQKQKQPQKQQQRQKQRQKQEQKQRPKATPGCFVYTAQPGDFPQLVAKRQFGVDLPSFLQANKAAITDIEKPLKPGTQLTVCSGTTPAAAAAADAAVRAAAAAAGRTAAAQAPDVQRPALSSLFYQPRPAPVGSFPGTATAAGRHWDEEMLKLLRTLQAFDDRAAFLAFGPIRQLCVWDLGAPFGLAAIQVLHGRQASAVVHGDAQALGVISYKHCVQLAAGEHVVRLQIASGLLVNGLKLFTDRGRELQLGSMAASGAKGDVGAVRQQMLAAPANASLASISGWVGSWFFSPASGWYKHVTGLQFDWTKPN